MRPSLTNVLVGVALVCAGYYANREPGETVVINHTRIDTVAPAGMMKLLEDGALENTRLNRLLRGYQSRPPIQIIRTDTLVTPPDTVLQLVSVRGADLTVAPLIRADSGWAPKFTALMWVDVMTAGRGKRATWCVTARGSGIYRPLWRWALVTLSVVGLRRAWNGHQHSGAGGALQFRRTRLVGSRPPLRGP